ncbi:MAG: hypothetical protein H6567_06585 [Lewinellaceae bacterium]|nr:hypothetical protein [Lewinellaceae bacterium]
MGYQNNLKNKIRQASPLPDSFGYDALEAGIMEKMKMKKKRRLFIAWWLLPLFILTIGIYFWNDKENTSTRGFEENKVKGQTHFVSQELPKNVLYSDTCINETMFNAEPVRIKKIPLHKQYNNKIHTPLFNNSENSIDLRLHYGEDSSILYSGLKNIKTDGVLGTSGTALNDGKLLYEFNKDRFQSSHENPYDKIQADKPSHTQSTAIENVASFTQNICPSAIESHSNTDSISNLIHSQSKLTFYQKPEENNSKLSYLETTQFPTLKLLSAPIIHSNLQSRTLLNTKILFPYVGKRQSFFLQSIIAFIHWNDSNAEPKMQQIRDDYEYIYILPNGGWEFSILGGIKRSNGILCTSGINYQMKYSIFEYEKNRVDTVSLNGQVVQIEKNILTGSEKFIYGTADITTLSTRKIKKNNTDQVVSIPILIGYSLRMKRWNMESQFGVSLNIFSHRTGTTKASGDIVSYDTKHPLSSLSVLGNFESRFSVHYHFNNQLYIGTNISLSKSIQSQILSDGIIYKPFQFSLGCVSGYEF